MADGLTLRAQDKRGALAISQRLVDKKKLATYQGEASHADINSALDAAVKAKLDSYQHDYNERNFLFLPAVI